MAAFLAFFLPAGGPHKSCYIPVRLRPSHDTSLVGIVRGDKWGLWLFLEVVETISQLEGVDPKAGDAIILESTPSLASSRKVQGNEAHPRSPT